MTPADERALVREQIRRNYGFDAPEAFVTDLMAFVDGRSVPGWSEGRSATFWQTIGQRYGFSPPDGYVEALKTFVDALEQLRAEGEAV